MSSQDQETFSNRKDASFLQQNESVPPSQESVTSDDDEDEDEEEDEVSIIKPSDHQMNVTAAPGGMYPQPQDATELNASPSGKTKKKLQGMEQYSHTQYGFPQHHGGQ